MNVIKINVLWVRLRFTLIVLLILLGYIYTLQIASYRAIILSYYI